MTVAVGSAFRLLSANLWNGRGDPAGFAALVEELRADVVAVQELTPKQAAALERVLPHGLLEPAHDFTGMGIALRRPGTVRRLLLPCRDAWVAEIRGGDAPGEYGVVEIINVHVQAPHSPPTWGTVCRRRGQMQGLERHLDAHPDRRCALVGDLNSTPKWPLYRRLAARLTDAALDVARRRGARAQPTWGPWANAPRILRIDHALVRGLLVQDFRVVRVHGCDHSAIVVDLVIPDRG